MMRLIFYLPKDRWTEGLARPTFRRSPGSISLHILEFLTLIGRNTKFSLHKAKLSPQCINKAKHGRGAPLAQFVECRTLDCKVVGSNLTKGAVLCP